MIKMQITLPPVHTRADIPRAVAAQAGTNEGKIKKLEIAPLNKFIINEKNSEKFKNEYKDYPELIEKFENSKYFEGINYFQTVFNDELKSFIDFIPNDTVVIFDESAEIYEKYRLLDENLKKQLSENVQSDLTPFLKKFNHFEFFSFDFQLLYFYKTFLK